MSSIKIVSLASFLLILGACSVFEPFVDRRRNAGQTDPAKIYVGRSTPQKPAICSNNLWTRAETIQALADKECQKHHTGTHAIKTDVSHLTCKLLLPTHTYFECQK
ncbi:MAG: hypothetical protein IKR60_01550 [Alphaproteobacteria bacterium]|nr:hypothetical protein [Alphaproteobacteria bacterium]